jgi:hypothetical protein
MVDKYTKIISSSFLKTFPLKKLNKNMDEKFLISQGSWISDENRDGIPRGI